MRSLLVRLLLLLGVIAIAIVLITPKPEFDGKSRAASDAGWRMPALGASPDTDRLVTALIASPLWGRAADNTTANANNSSWRLAGITGSGADRVVLIELSESRISPLKAGDKFPDGTLIQSVRENGVCVSIDGKRRLLPVDPSIAPLVW
jgi:hypothetical protein